LCEKVYNEKYLMILTYKKLTMEKIKKVKSPKKKECEYKLPNICRKTADVQIVFRLGSVNLAKYWACNSCGVIVEKERNKQK
jgi:hypothetical protein